MQVGVTAPIRPHQQMRRFWKRFRRWALTAFFQSRTVPMSSPSHKARPLRRSGSTSQSSPDSSDGPESPTGGQPETGSQSTPRAPRNPVGESAPPQGALLLLLPYRSPDSIDKHPAVATWLRRGWRVASAEERLMEGEGTRLLVILRPAEGTSAEETSSKNTSLT